MINEYIKVKNKYEIREEIMTNRDKNDIELVRKLIKEIQNNEYL